MEESDWHQQQLNRLHERKLKHPAAMQELQFLAVNFNFTVVIWLRWTKWREHARWTWSKYLKQTNENYVYKKVFAKHIND